MVVNDARWICGKAAMVLRKGWKAQLPQIASEKSVIVQNSNCLQQAFVLVQIQGLLANSLQGGVPLRIQRFDRLAGGLLIHHENVNRVEFTRRAGIHESEPSCCSRDGLWVGAWSHPRFV